MPSSLKDALSDETLESLGQRVIDAAEAGDDDEAWEAIQPLRRAQRHQQRAASRLVGLVERRLLPLDKALDVLADVQGAHASDEEILALVGEALESARDIDDLNAAPPDHPLFLDVADGLAELAAQARGGSNEQPLLLGLATAARMVARQRDELAENSHRRLVELAPDSAASHYNLGLLLKTRGRFREGMIANRAAADLVDEAVEPYEWNLGICATGAGEGRVALDVWKRMGQKIRMGRFELPEGGYPMCKVKLAERPLAERSADADDPGLEETIWIERLSPCHGIVRSVLYQDLGVDFGDVVLMDGAPITHHSYGEEQVPVFPHLATLLRRDYRLYDFAGTQDQEQRLAGSSNDLPEDAVVYSHTEQYRTLCKSCWRDGDLDHARHEEEVHHVVTGRIAAPGHIEPGELLGRLDAAVAAREPCRIYVPDLCEAAGLADRAAVEKRRFDMLQGG